jgi:hypothetical protein
MRNFFLLLFVLACFASNAQVQKIELLTASNTLDDVFGVEKAKARFIDAYWNENQNQLYVFTLKAREGFINGTNYTDRLLVTHILDKDLKILDKKEFLISKTGEKEDVINQRVSSLQQLYPLLFDKKTRKEVNGQFINVAMLGLSFTKYNNSYTANETSFTFNPSIMDYKTYQRTIKVELDKILGVNVFENTDFAYTTPAGILSTAMSFNDKEDKIAQYKNFHFMSFDPEGNIINHDSVKYDFPRGLYRKMPLFNETMEYTGTSYMLYRYTGLGGKKQDPEDTKYDFIKVGPDGKMMTKKTFLYGEKTYAFKPSFSFEKAGKMYVAATNKQGTTLLVFNDKGEYEKQTNVVDDSYVYKTYGAELKSELWDHLMEFVCMYTDKEQNSYMLGRFYQPTKETLPSGKEKIYNKYFDYILFKLTPNGEFNILGAIKDPTGVSGSLTTPKVHLLKNDGTKASFIFENTVDATSSIVTFENGKASFSANQEPGYAYIKNRVWKVENSTDKANYFISVKGNSLLISKK